MPQKRVLIFDNKMRKFKENNKKAFQKMHDRKKISVLKVALTN